MWKSHYGGYEGERLKVKLIKKYLPCYPYIFQIISLIIIAYIFTENQAYAGKILFLGD